MTIKTPPRLSSGVKVPSVIVKEKSGYLLWMKIQRNFPKVERLGLGIKIDQNFLAVLDYTFTSAYLPRNMKSATLSKAISRLDMVKFFLQLAWEIKLVTNEKYIELADSLESIGKDLGSWRKSLENPSTS